MFRRRSRDPESDAVRDAFRAVAVEVDGAQRALLVAIPTSRDPGVPLAQALAEFAGRLGRARAGMDGWRTGSLAHEWTSCLAGMDAASAEAERLRLEPATLGFEALNARVWDVLHPLEVFADVERELRRL